ncbi:phage capsid protein [Melissococcus plutonius]|uniref:phage capsid protein n=1 Tax=Melissococcus plutonius TaxID=33970 RepID=UPI000F7BD699|nr:phage capsid protein [Melissococcus plutonius]BBD17119.1 major structural protein 2 [Melissococcus plutonius]BBP07675.1 major structural protein 2 [Melissococcus plutonius]
MTKTMEQAIFNAMVQWVSTHNYTMHTYQPLNNVEHYPFVVFEQTKTMYQANKTALLGNVTLFLSVWGEQEKRSQVSEMATTIFKGAFGINEAQGYYWSLNREKSMIQLLMDTTTNQPLVRANIELNFNLLGGI